MTAASKIHVAKDLDGFFESEVRTIAQRQGLNLSPVTALYLGRVLSRFSDARTYLQNSPHSEKSEEREYPTLALIWLNAARKNQHEQYQSYQLLGDIALFTSGFFSERIQRSLVDMDYYVAMGEKAYKKAGQLKETLLLEKRLNVFFELSGSFSRLVEVFAEISDRTLTGNDQDLLKLYEKWLASGSERIRRILAEGGVIAAHAAAAPATASTPHSREDSDGDN